MMRFFALFFAVFLLSHSVRAQSSFSDIPILYEGRVQPMGSFAKNVLEQKVSSALLVEPIETTQE